MSILNHFFDYKPEVLALDEKELPHLQHLFENGTANGVPGMKILSREEALAMEPNLSEKVCGALWAPSAAIVNPWEYALAMTEVAVRNGVELRRSCKVTDAEATEGGYRLTVPGGTVETRCVINAAGIWADKVHSMVEPANFRIIPTRGEYYLLDKSEGTRVSHVIFQCPNALGKGVLVTPTDEILGDNSYDRLVSYYSAPLEVLFEANADISTYELWTTSDSCYVITEDTSEEEAADPETASQVVATLSSKLVEVNDSYVSRSVMVFGSSVIFTDSFMNTTAFSDADYVRDLLLYITGTDASSVTTSTERVQTNVLDVTASRGTINILGIVFIAGIPVVILAAGLIIFLKRRHL